MACSSGNSSGSSQLVLQNQSSGSEEELRLLMDQRKRKRMQSNRESARRSRMRKQQHLDGLMAQVARLREDKNQMISRINITTQLFLNVEAENSVLRAQMMELSHRLESLNEILFHINTTTDELDFLQNLDDYDDHNSFNDNNNPLFNSFFLSQQPIVASADHVLPY